MNAESTFYLIIGIIIVKYIFDTVVNAINAAHFKDAVPNELAGIYSEEEYLTSQNYKKANYKFSFFVSSFTLIITLLFFFLDGFAFIDSFVRQFTSHHILVTLLFFGCIMFMSDILTTPFSWYKTFVIEEKFGFNRSNYTTFIADKLKSWLMMTVIGGGILALITWFYEETTNNFWWMAWILIATFSVFMNMFYSKLIVPLFNKQSPLEDGELKDDIHHFADSVGFKLDNIFVIDGSKRSSKANAYFSGFGNQKRITLYDTLINDLTKEEVVAVLAHEVGHYKRNHIVYSLISSVILTGITLFILSLLVGNDVLSQALGVENASFHIGLIAFTILYSPISEITGIIMNYFSRIFEYQADNYAKQHFDAAALISSLKKLSKNSLSNLTPHSFYVKIHYSHPTLLQRILNLKK